MRKIKHLSIACKALILILASISPVLTLTAIYAESGDNIGTDSQAVTVQIPPNQNDNVAATPTSTSAPSFSQAELDQMLAPIALYPDALLSQILMAATYPLEIVEAARWSQANPNLKGDDAVYAAKQNNWDPSVLSLVAFPQVLGMMDQRLEWTERLGDAFLAQQSQLMESVQKLRQQAQLAGNLQSNDQFVVRPQGQAIAIEPVLPQVIYVPYYDPNLVYGSWVWSNYPPVYWNPWPGYVVRPHYVSGFYFSSGINIRADFFFGRCDWHRRQVSVVNVNNYYYHNTIVQNNSFNNRVITSTTSTANVRSGNNVSFAWQHDARHRLGVPYQHTVFQGTPIQANPASMQNLKANSAVGAQPNRELQNNGASNAPSTYPRNQMNRNQTNHNQRTMGNSNNMQSDNTPLNSMPVQTPMPNTSIQSEVHSMQTPSDEHRHSREPHASEQHQHTHTNAQPSRTESSHNESIQHIDAAPAQNSNAASGYRYHH